MTIDEFKRECLRLNSHYSEIFGRDVYELKEFNLFYSQNDIGGIEHGVFVRFIDHILSTRTSSPDVSLLSILFDSFLDEERKRSSDRRVVDKTDEKVFFTKIGGCCGGTGKILAVKENNTYAFRCDWSLGNSYRHYPSWHNQSGFTRVEQ